jgi:hypothetical protein
MRISQSHGVLGNFRSISALSSILRIRSLSDYAECLPLHRIPHGEEDVRGFSSNFIVFREKQRIDKKRK